MLYSNQAKSWLLVVCEITDCHLLDSAIQERKSHLHKLGDKVYLGDYHASPQDVYQALKDDHGVSGEVRWIELPIAVVTDRK